MKNYFKKFSIMFVMSLILMLGCATSAFAEDIDSNTKLLMHMDDGTFKDEIGHTVTNNGVTLDTNNKVFGTGSASFNGSSYLSIPNSTDFNLGTTFTIDFRFYSTSSNPTSFFLGNTAGGIGTYGSNSGFAIFLSDGGIYITGATGGGGWNNGKIFGAVTFSQNTWYHIAVVNNNGTATIYVNGNSVASGTFPDNTSTKPLIIGGEQDLSSHTFLNGKLEELRIVKGKALWTTNFTPPTAPYFESVSLDKSTMDLTEGDSKQLTATTTPLGAQVTWKSSDPSIATVDSNGKVTAVKEGTCTITATTTDGLTATCTVNITKQSSSSGSGTTTDNQCRTITNSNGILNLNTPSGFTQNNNNGGNNNSSNNNGNSNNSGNSGNNYSNNNNSNSNNNYYYYNNYYYNNSKTV